MLEFSYRPQIFYSFYRREGRSGGTLIEWGSYVDVLVPVLPPPHFRRENVVKLRSSEAAILT